MVEVSVKLNLESIDLSDNLKQKGRTIRGLEGEKLFMRIVGIGLGECTYQRAKDCGDDKFSFGNLKNIDYSRIKEVYRISSGHFFPEI